MPSIINLILISLRSHISTSVKITSTGEFQMLTVYHLGVEVKVHISLRRDKYFTFVALLCRGRDRRVIKVQGQECVSTLFESFERETLCFIQQCLLHVFFYVKDRVLSKSLPHL